MKSGAKSSAAALPPLRIGVAGLGTVGAGLLHLLEKHGVRLSATVGRKLELTAVSARTRSKDRGVPLADVRWVDDPVKLATDPEIDCFVSVAPPANSYDFAFLAPCPSSGLIVGAEKDEVVPQADIQKLVARLSLQKGITVESRTIKGANHFFHDSLDKLAVDVALQ